VLVTEHHRIEIRDLESEMVEAGFRSLHAEEDVMVDISLAAIDAVEGRDHVALVVAENLVAPDEAQHFAIPGERFL